MAQVPNGRTDHTTLSYAEALMKKRCESFETTPAFFFTGTVVQSNDGRKSCRVMFAALTGEKSPRKSPGSGRQSKTRHGCLIDDRKFRVETALLPTAASRWASDYVCSSKRPTYTWSGGRNMTRKRGRATYAPWVASKGIGRATQWKQGNRA